ncbi:MAG: hypothetical protein ACK5BV_05035 [Bacteroidota bacterium]|jgi:hypothetical protein
MISKEDEDFIRWWELNRDDEKKWERSIKKGLGMGLMLSFPIVLAVLFRGWYKRMPFISGSQLLLILLGCLFVSVFYALMKGHMQWETNETRYRQLKNL